MDQLPATARPGPHVNKVIANESRLVRYFDTASAVVLDRDEAFALPNWGDRLRSASLHAHLCNGVPPVTRPDQYTSVAGLVPIPPRTKWRYDGTLFHVYFPVELPRPHLPASLADIEATVQRYVKFLRGERIAVELSGGLDTSIVIEVLRSAGANLVLIGFISDRYEFRTERAIQEFYLRGHEPAVTIPVDDARPFARLEGAPLHPVPLVPALFHEGHEVVSRTACAYGARFVLNGVGGDALLCDTFDGDAGYSMPLTHRSWGLYDPWPHDHVYAPKGMAYISSFALGPISRLVWAMRRGSGEDVQKRWARASFEGRLPRELTRYAYKADHVGLFHEGLSAAEPGIQEVARSAFGVTRHESLRPAALLRDVARSTHLNDAAIRALLLRLAFCTWIHAFVREGRV